MVGSTIKLVHTSPVSPQATHICQIEVKVVKSDQIKNFTETRLKIRNTRNKKNEKQRTRERKREREKP